MTEAKHTPGPWIMRPWKNSRATAITTDVNNAGKDICNVMGLLPEAKANARLITAAPDMLEALQLVQDCPLLDTATLLLIDAALSKAKGE